jgi:hypothetical protein
MMMILKNIRKSTFYNLYEKEGIGSLSADEQASLLTRASLWGLASPLFRRS